MQIHNCIYSAIFCSLLAACGGGESAATSASDPNANSTTVPAVTPGVTTTRDPLKYPVSSYKTLKFRDETSFDKTALISSSSPNLGSITIDGIALGIHVTTLPTPGDDISGIDGWAGTFAHKVDARAIMLCDSMGKSKYVLIEDSSPRLTINDLKGETFEYVEDCTKATSPIQVNQDGSIVNAINATILTAANLTTAFSATGYTEGNQTTYLRAYKVQYADGRYWDFVIEIGKNNTDSTKGYISWWKQTAPIN